MARQDPRSVMKKSSASLVVPSVIVSLHFCFSAPAALIVPSALRTSTSAISWRVNPSNRAALRLMKFPLAPVSRRSLSFWFVPFTSARTVIDCSLMLFIVLIENSTSSPAVSSRSAKINSCLAVESRSRMALHKSTLGLAGSGTVVSSCLVGVEVETLLTFWAFGFVHFLGHFIDRCPTSFLLTAFLFFRSSLRLPCRLSRRGLNIIHVHGDNLIASIGLLDILRKRCDSSLVASRHSSIFLGILPRFRQLMSRPFFRPLLKNSIVPFASASHPAAVASGQTSRCMCLHRLLS
ncbi:hypothetical protein EDB92DRAFT_693736 [Lactarius akahatsu]|uniref:Uncharacterized protein n=1 Tax=Lactarius akahatsu TaxID=416441 RepID=A0AAD4L5U4_9AGAM|nr:hypothetical protein EDB92DRAFT_693736 [Lactarius akahatsu]